MTDQTPKRRGRPPKARPEETPAPAAPAPARKARAKAAPALPEPTFIPERLTVHAGLILLEVQDPADLDALLSDTRLSPHVAERLAPTFALLRPGTDAAALDALRRAGHTPRVNGGQP
ncbi:hypothetical protein GCM10008959_40150 [Deinococcus seoulensis]|uniref:Uncharacterized protein n=1 Tax=Deinococcus seoulensis TaxID=1837379 RepID=A0ABQ2RY66_9DEIO|nr:hypothetical protein [Deinococcus seoulensis]GGR74972.1 hypothetical protein GCM10008959_40150 [Deinococcus seoulensis]